MSECAGQPERDTVQVARGGSVALLTTCHLERDGLSDLLRLVGSVQVAIAEGEVENLRHVILLQGCESERRKELEDQFPPWVELLSTTESLSSPEARNVLIRHLLNRDRFDPLGFVAFPDDDAWYPRGALTCVSKHFQGSGDMQLLLTRYGPSPSIGNCDRIMRASLQQALTNGACATIFIRGDLLARLGGFNELLGLGTELRGGEDTELVHRACHGAQGKTAFIPAALVGHAIAEPRRKAQYYEGALAALMAHRRESGSAQLAFLRKLAVGVWLVLRRRLGLSEYLGAVRKAHDYAAAIQAGPNAATKPPRRSSE